MSSLNNHTRAHLTTELTCGDAALCVLVPQPGGRGSFQLLLTMLIPILIASFQSLHMKWAYRTPSRKLLDVMLRIFFPEGVLWLVLHEERERQLVMKELKQRHHDSRQGGYLTEATNQQLMAVQAGRMYLELVSTGHNNGNLPSTEPGDHANRNEPEAIGVSLDRSPSEIGFDPQHPVIPANLLPYPVSRSPSLREPSSVYAPGSSSSRGGQLASLSVNQITQTLDTSSRTSHSRSSHVANIVVLPYPKIIWSSEKPTGHRRLGLGDLNEFSALLNSLPNGQRFSLPDLTFMMLIFQEAWLLMTVTTRLLSRDQQYRISILEIFAIFSLTIFLVERIVTRNNKPAWTNQYVIIQMDKATYQPPFPVSHRHRFQGNNPFALPGVLAPAISVILWSVSLLIYGTLTSPAYHTRIACQISAIVYILAIVYFMFLKLIDKRGYEPLGNWTRWLPPTWCVYVVAVFSRLVILGFAIVQIFLGEKAIFDGPVVWAMIPHIGA